MSEQELIKIVDFMIYKPTDEEFKTFKENSIKNFSLTPKDTFFEVISLLEEARQLEKIK